MIKVIGTRKSEFGDKEFGDINFDEYERFTTIDICSNSFSQLSEFSNEFKYYSEPMDNTPDDDGSMKYEYLLIIDIPYNHGNMKYLVDEVKDNVKEYNNKLRSVLNE